MSKGNLARLAVLSAAVLAAAPGYTAPPPPPSSPPKAQPLPTDDSTNGNAIGSEVKKPLMPTKVSSAGAMSAPPGPMMPEVRRPPRAQPLPSENLSV